MVVNVARRMIGGVGSNEVGQDSRANMNRGNPPLLFRVVVVDVIYDPDSLEEGDRTLLKSQVSNPEFVDSMPPNSVIGRVVSGGQDLTNPSCAVFFPLVSSHIQLPVQPGEQVYVLYENYGAEGATQGKWLARIHEGIAVEDTNYTHSDRRLDPSLMPSLTRLADDSSSRTATNTVPTFLNGGGVQGAFSLQPSGSQNPYDLIVQQANASKISVREPVPRWIKRPQELVIQGMNNSLISLGQDRVGPALRVSGSAQTDKTTHAGAIDIVCGRGRGGLPYDPSREPNPVSEKTGTSPLVVLNARNNKEVDKVPVKRNKRRNRNEGNPDFKRDAARLYVAMNTAGDKNFRTGHSSNSIEGFLYPDNTVRPTQTVGSEEGVGNAYVIAKADHVRIVGRKETDPNINGSILLLREGVADQDLSFMYLEGGKVQLEAQEIHLGKSTTKTEPYIKWTVYEQHLNELKTQIKTLADQVKAITAAYNTAFANSVASPFVPIATLVTVGPSVDIATGNIVNTVKQRIDTINPTDAKSRKLFGE